MAGRWLAGSMAGLPAANVAPVTEERTHTGLRPVRTLSLSCYPAVPAASEQAACVDKVMFGRASGDLSGDEQYVFNDPLKISVNGDRNMKSVCYGLLILLVTLSTASAQVNDGSAVILPLEAQTCKLPSAPAKVPEDADFETLKVGKARIAQFQQDLQTYRACLEESGTREGLTDGNRFALDRAHDYSVEMETRIAEQFNVAVRAYKARQEQP